MKNLLMVLTIALTGSSTYAADLNLNCSFQADNPGTPRQYVPKIYSGTLRLRTSDNSFHFYILYFASGMPTLQRYIEGRIRVEPNYAPHPTAYAIELLAEKSTTKELLCSPTDVDDFPTTLGTLMVNDTNGPRTVEMNLGRGFALGSFSTSPNTNFPKLICK